MLTSIGRDLLEQFFAQFEHALALQGISLPGQDLSDDLFYSAADVILNSETQHPPQMKEALLAIQGMTVPEAQGALIAAAQRAGILEGLGGADRASLAMRVWLNPRAFAEWQAARDGILKLSAFVCFRNSLSDLPRAPLALPSEAVLQDITGLFDAWFAQTHRGLHTTRIQVDPTQPGQYRFVVRHADFPQRVYDVNQQHNELIDFTPEGQDLILYLSNPDELWIAAHSKEDIPIYRNQFALALCGSVNGFSEPCGLNLELLRSDGLPALDPRGVENIQQITLRGIKISHGGGFVETTAREADDLLASATHFNKQEDAIPAEGTLTSASFLFKFASSEELREVRLSLPNTIELQRADDAPFVAVWLARSGLRAATSLASSITSKAA